MSRASLLALAAAAAFLATVGTARADGGPKINDSLWLPLGLNAGYAINPDPVSNGFLFGPEASFVYLDRSGYWGGTYVDVLRDFGAEVTRLSAGLEGGYAIFGLDVGWVGKTGEPFRHGLRGRLMLSLAAVHLYGGIGHLYGDGGTTYGEAGVLLKFPILLWEEPRHWYRGPVDPGWQEPPPPPPEPEYPQPDPTYPPPRPYSPSSQPAPSPPFAQPPPP